MVLFPNVSSVTDDNDYVLLGATLSCPTKSIIFCPRCVHFTGNKTNKYRSSSILLTRFYIYGPSAILKVFMLVIPAIIGQ